MVSVQDTQIPATATPGPSQLRHPTRYKEIVLIPINDLMVDDRYQRRTKAGRIEYFRRNWNQQEAEEHPIWVSQREDGTYWIKDGQHRVAAMKLLKFTHAWCEVKPSTGIEGESLGFSTRNNVLHVDAIDRYRSDLTAGKPTAVALENITTRCGWTIQTRGHKLRRAGDVVAINALEECYQLDRDTLESALSILLSTWPDEPKIGDSHLITAVFQLIRRNKDRFNHKHFTRRLGKIGLITLIRRGKRRAQEEETLLSTAIAREIELIYNWKLQPQNRISRDSEKES